MKFLMTNHVQNSRKTIPCDLDVLRSQQRFFVDRATIKTCYEWSETIYSIIAEGIHLQTSGK